MNNPQGQRWSLDWIFDLIYLASPFDFAHQQS